MRKEKSIPKKLRRVSINAAFAMQQAITAEPVLIAKLTTTCAKPTRAIPPTQRAHIDGA